MAVGGLFAVKDTKRLGSADWGDPNRMNKRKL